MIIDDPLTEDDPTKPRDPRLAKLQALRASGVTPPAPADDRLGRLQRLLAQRKVDQARTAEAMFGPIDAQPGGNGVAPTPRVLGANQEDSTPPEGNFGSYMKQVAAGAVGRVLSFPAAVGIQTARDVARTGSTVADVLQGSPIHAALQRATAEQGGLGMPSSTPGGSPFERAERGVDEFATAAENRVVGKPLSLSDVQGRKFGEMEGNIIPLVPAALEMGGSLLGRVFRKAAAPGVAAPPPEEPIVTPPPPPDPEPISSHAEPAPPRAPQPSTNIRTFDDIQKEIGQAKIALAEAQRRGSPLALEYQKQIYRLAAEAKKAMPKVMPEGGPASEAPPPPARPDIAPPTTLTADVTPEAEPPAVRAMRKAAKPLPPDLDAMAQRVVDAWTPGVGDPTDQMVVASERSRLSAGDKKTLSAKVDQLSQARQAEFEKSIAPATPVESPRGVAHAKTGEPFRATLLRGEGSTTSPYNELSAGVPILGKAKYTTPDPEFAQHFGPNITEHQVELKNPLVIDSDQQWRELTQKAGWEFPNPTGLPPEQAKLGILKLRRQIEDAGHDGVVVKVDYAKQGDNVKTLGRVFGADQAIEFKPAGKAPPEPKYAPAEAHGQGGGELPMQRLRQFSDKPYRDARSAFQLAKTPEARDAALQNISEKFGPEWRAAVEREEVQNLGAPRFSESAKPAPRFTAEGEGPFTVRDAERNAPIQESTTGGELRVRQFATREDAQAWADQAHKDVAHASEMIARRKPAAERAPKAKPERPFASYYGATDEEIMDKSTTSRDLGDRPVRETLDLFKTLTAKAEAARGNRAEMERVQRAMGDLYDKAGAGEIRGVISNVRGAITRHLKKLPPDEPPAGPSGSAPKKPPEPKAPESSAPFEPGDAYEGEPTAAPSPPKNPKYRKMDDQALLARRNELVDRLQEAQQKVDIRPFARENQYNEAKHTGTVLGQKGDRGLSGRSIGRMKDDGRLIDEIDIELKARGIPEGQVADAYDAHTSAKAEAAKEKDKPITWFDGTVFMHGSIPGAIAGGIVGADYDRDHPVKGALIGAAAGAALGARMSRQARVRSAITDDLLSFLAPGSREGGGIEAANTIRHRNADLARSQERAVEYLKQYRKLVKQLTPDQAHHFIDDIENGRPTHPALQPLANALRTMMDRDRTEVQELGTGRLTHFYVDYFPHIWKDPTKAKDVIKRILGKRPLEGPKSFLKQRSIISVKEGLEAGLELATNNPLDLVLLKHREVQRYIMGQRIMADFREEGLARFVKATEQKPDGFFPLDDRVATVFGPGIGGGSITIRGHYFAPEPVAKVLNNFLSPGLRGHKAYDAYMGLGNLMNQIQLGLSFFHLGFTSLDASISKMALGVGQLGHGAPLQAVKSALSIPVAPLTTIWRGVKLRHAYLYGAEGAEIERVVDGLVEGGGRIRMDSFYKNNEVAKFLDSFKNKRMAGTLGHAIPAALELFSKPVLEWVVPRQKLGVFSDLYRFELSRMPENSTLAMRKDMARRVWDSVDNRMGQMVYDNLFWNRITKDLAMATTRSVGWNLGTVRELGGGANDLLNGKLTPRAQYVIALPIVLGLYGAVTTYLFTGHGPQTLKDYYLPPTGRVNEDGNQERMQLPSYGKDVIAYERHPLTTLGHKAQPLLATILDMLNNEDYFGDEIRNKNDPWVRQAKQVALFLGRQIIPFGIRNMMQEQQHKQSLATKALPFIGVTPAPRDLVRSPAQQLMAEDLSRRGFPQRTPEEADASDRRQAILSALRKGSITPRQVNDSAKVGALTHRQALDVMRRAKEPPILGRFKQLEWQEAEDVYKQGTPQEQKLWWPTLWKKRAGALDQLMEAGVKDQRVKDLRALMHREHLNHLPGGTR